MPRYTKFSAQPGRAAAKLFYAPADAAIWVVKQLLGSTLPQRVTHDTDVKEAPAKKTSGLVTLALDGASWIARKTADFIANHRKAIAVAAWASLIVSGAAALTIALLPAATLATVVGFSVLGYSIGGIAGAGASTATLAAVGAGLAAAAVSTATYVTATLANGYHLAKNYFTCKSCAKKPEAVNNNSFDDGAEYTDSPSAYGRLGGPASNTTATRRSDVAPVAAKGTPTTYARAVDQHAAPEASDTQTATMSRHN